jgi:hypothetical protein
MGFLLWVTIGFVGKSLFGKSDPPDYFFGKLALSVQKMTYPASNTPAAFHNVEAKCPMKSM